MKLCGKKCDDSTEDAAVTFTANFVSSDLGVSTKYQLEGQSGGKFHVKFNATSPEMYATLLLLLQNVKGMAGEVRVKNFAFFFVFKLQEKNRTSKSYFVRKDFAALIS